MKIKTRKNKPRLVVSRSTLAKDIIKWLFMGGMVCIAATSPYFLVNLSRDIERWKNNKRKRIGDMFSLLEKRGFIEISKEGKQVYISLTEDGKRLAGLLQIDELKIKKPEKWDRQWRLVLFDISELRKTQREAFRGKLIQLGFQLLQKSVWVHVFDCRREVEILRAFFGLSQEELRLITARDIGDDKDLKKLFEVG